MALQENNIMLLDAAGFPRTIDSATDSLGITTDLTIGGDLTVNGDIVSIGVRDVVVTDNFIDLNNGNIATARAGGLTVQVEGIAARSQALNAGAGVTFQSIGTSASANARFKVDGIDFTTVPAAAADRVAVNDIIQISGLSDAGENNGLFVVKSIAAGAGGWVEIKTVGERNTSTPFVQTEFEDATEDVPSSVVAWSLNIGVMAISDGGLPAVGGGTVTKGNFTTAYAADADDQAGVGTGFQYGDATAVSLQEAYNEGATITTAGNTNLALTLASGNFTAAGAGAVNLTPSGASSFTSGAALTLTGGAASTWSTGAGLLTLDGAGGVAIAGNAAEVDITTSGAVDINSGAGTWNASTFDLTASAASTWTGLSVAIDSTGGALNLDAVGGGVSITAAQASDFTTAAGALTITAAAGSTWSTGSGLLTLDGAGGVAIAGNAAEVDITTSGAVDINSGAGTWNASTFDLTASAASTWTGLSVGIDSTGGALNLDAVGGGVSITAAQASDFTCAAGALTITAAAASTWSTGAGLLTLNGAGGVAIAGNANEVDITTTGDVDINSMVGMWNATGTDNASPISITLDANNAGSNEGRIDLKAKSIIQIGDSGTYAGAIISTQHWIDVQRSGGFSGTSGEALTAGDAVYLKNDGGVAKLFKADDNHAEANGRIVHGLVTGAAGAAGVAMQVMSLVGSVVATGLTGLAAGTVGDPLFLSSTAGGLTLTAPTASGTTVYRVGYVAGAATGVGGTCEMLFAPQFISNRP
jgi:hypothetical protein